MSACSGGRPPAESPTAVLTRIGERLQLSDKPLGTGTYGRVHGVDGDSGRAVKVYRDWWLRAPRRQRELRIRKLEAMAAMTPPDLGDDAVAAWPTDVVALANGPDGNVKQEGSALDNGSAGWAGPVDGYVMPQAPAGSVTLSTLVWAHRGSDEARLAAELVKNAMSALHEQGVVIGDVNARNFALSQDGRLWLYDADGWQFREDGGFLHFAHGATDYYTHRSVFDRISGTQPNCVDQRCPLTGRAHAPTPSCQPRDPYHDRYGVTRMVEDLTGRRKRRT